MSNRPPLTSPGVSCSPARFFTTLTLLFSSLIPATATAQRIIVAGAPADGAQQPAAGVDEAVQNAVTDFQRHSGRGEWQKAFRVLENLPVDKRVGMLPTGDGFLIPAETQLWQMLVNVNAEGRAAFRLFHEPNAKKLYNKLESELASNNPQATTTAREIFDQYFITSYGDDAANLLGDVAFERGEFAEAISRWKSILDYHTDTNIPLPRVLVKTAAAYVASGRAGEAGELSSQLKQQYPGELVKVAGKDVNAAEYVSQLVNSMAKATEAAVASARFDLPPGTLQPAWNVQYLSPKGRVSLQQAVAANSYYQSGLETIVPNSAADSERIYLNWMGVIFAVDVNTGKLAWRTDSFSKVPPHFSEMQQGRVDLSQYAIQVVGDRVLTTALPLDRLNYWQPPIPLTCWNAKTGEKFWSQGGEQGGQQSYLGVLYPWQGNLLVITHGQQQSSMTLGAISLTGGVANWSIPIGTFEGKNNPYTGGRTFSVPEFAEVGGKLCLMTQSGRVLRISPDEKKILGQFVMYEPKTTSEGNQVFYSDTPLSEEKRLHTRGRMLVSNGVLLLKEVGQSELYCVDMESQKLLWKRPTVSSAMIVEADDQHVYLMNSELSAYDRATGKLHWSIRLPVSGGGLSMASSGDSVFVATQRGIYELHKQDGRIARIVRTGHTDSSGISMRIVGNHLVTVTNYDVVGYKLSSPQQSAPMPPAQ
ncbi:MAG: PQQ-binding-like beta-propeller repeat protein [Planctomycetaceae bacterium]